MNTLPLDDQETPSPSSIVLIVEDDETLTEFFVTFLAEEYGLPVSYCTPSVKGAITFLDEHTPCLVLLDFLLLGPLTGGEVLTRIRSTPRLTQIPVLLMTASRAGERPGLAEAVALATRTIYKPFEVEDLLTALREVFPVQVVGCG